MPPLDVPAGWLDALAGGGHLACALMLVCGCGLNFLLGYLAGRGRRRSMPGPENVATPSPAGNTAPPPPGNVPT